MGKIAIVYHSGFGHTHVLAESVAEGVREAGAEPVLLRIEGADQDFQPLLDAVKDADGVVFGAPTYMGDLSAGFRTFAEATAPRWYVQEWKDDRNSVCGRWKDNDTVGLGVYAAEPSGKPRNMTLLHKGDAWQLR